MMSKNESLKPPMMMKLKRKKFGNTQRLQCDPYIKQKKPDKKKYCHGDEICKRQLMNPFQSTRKTQNLLEIKDKEDIKQDDNLFNIVLSRTSSSQKSTDESYTLPEFTVSTGKLKEECSSATASTPSRDWSIKQEYKLQSSKTFKWCSHTLLKPSEEARCTALFAARQQPEDCSDKEKLRYYLSYWIHPNLPWLKLFPRDRPSVSKSESTVLRSEATAGLQNDWCNAFESLFGQLKSGHCPYFYLCSHNTTVLFRQQDNSLSADMVPTTYGVRNALKQEDIQFTMPLAHELLNTEALEQENLADSNEDSGDARDFLHSLGIDSKRYSQLDPSVVKIRAASRLKLDHSIRSLVRVEGSQVQGVFNFLLNNKSLTPTVGELAGVPPTLLSPSVFVGGTIRHSQVKCGSSHARQEDGTMGLVHFLHLSGPLLPSGVEGINSLLSHTQEDFTGKLESLQNSTAFNSPDLPLVSSVKSTGGDAATDSTVDGSADATADDSEVSTTNKAEEELISKAEKKGSTIHELKFQDGMFSMR